jgi:hypothetical protein
MFSLYELVEKVSRIWGTCHPKHLKIFAAAAAEILERVNLETDG